MHSFRTELEDLDNPIVARDILDLEQKIRLFREGKIDAEKFRSLRLVRGIYGQRQAGVQMIRIKLPFGRITTRQLRTIADLSDEYASRNLHATTRQDIQIHFVSLDRTPELWAKLEQDDITLREACGNTVRNITASATAGIDPAELFDVSPYADALFRYLLRNPFCQEMGRKIKIAFSATDADTAVTFIHDLGFIPRLRGEERGFKVLIGGGLGANPHLAQVAYEFLPAEQIVPFTEAVLRVFDRYGERNRRMKARLKFLLDELGLDQFMALVAAEAKALPHATFPINLDALPEPVLPPARDYGNVVPQDVAKFERWRDTNVFAQKQDGFFGVYVKLPLGNLSSDRARQFADVAAQFAADDLRVTINQGYLLRYVRPDTLGPLFIALDALGLAEPGFDSTADITACPGTDSCNLAISDSTSISLEFERVIRDEYPELIRNNHLKIKISGCPNSCGQHGLAGIGFHGSSMKDKAGNVLPSLVVLLGGGALGAGDGRISEKVIKIPSRRGPDALRLLLDDYEQNALDGEYYHNYVERLGRPYFYTLLKPLTDLDTLLPLHYMDWGQADRYVLQTAVGECAGVMIDLVATLFFESEEKLALARETFENRAWADSIYHSYSAFINTAKALLLLNDAKPSTQIQVLNQFQEQFVDTGLLPERSRSGVPAGAVLDFKESVLRINQHAPDEAFARQYRADATRFLETAVAFRATQAQPVAA